MNEAYTSCTQSGGISSPTLACGDGVPPSSACMAPFDGRLAGGWVGGRREGALARAVEGKEGQREMGRERGLSQGCPRRGGRGEGAGG